LISCAAEVGVRASPFRILQARVTLLAGFFTLGQACSISGSATPPTVTPAQATQVVRDFWRGHEQATMGLDVVRFGHVETGMPLEADRAATTAAKALGTPAPAAPRPLRQVAVYVPHQSGYPTGFLARIETDSVDGKGQPVAVYYHFGRAAAGAPWLADFSARADPRRPIRFALDSAGYASILPINTSAYVLQPQAVADALSDYLMSGLESGTPTGPFAPGTHTSGVVQSLRDSYDQLERQGYEPSGDLAAHDFTRAYRDADGSAIVLFAVEATSRVALLPPNETSVTCIVQSPDHLQQWGGLVSSGQYSEIDFVDLLQLIAHDPRGGSHRHLDVIAGSDDRVAARTSVMATRSWLPSCPS
jgi:hypothetical protein